MAKAKNVLASVIGMVAGKADEGSGVDLVGAIVEAVKRLAADSEFIQQAVAALRAAGVRIPEEKPKAEPVAESVAAAAEAVEPPEEPVDGDVSGAPESLSWCYGGFNGSKAAVVEDAMLRGVKLKGDTFTIEWDKGDCRNLGATSKEDSDHTVACLFLENGKGGKFEWISTSRKTRSTENIKDGYNKWPKSALDKGGRLWFCIAGVKDDKKTSNGKRTALVEVERK